MPDAELTLPALQDWGRTLGAALRRPAVVTLAGDLGSGKTTLVQAICEGLGVAEPVTSPTFALVHEYTSPRGTVYHLDLYRLRSPSQLAPMGWDDILSSGGIVLVEWPERAAGMLPLEATSLLLEHVEGREDLRRLRGAQLAADRGVVGGGP